MVDIEEVTSIPKKPVDAEWRRWIRLNISRGCCRRGIRDILESNGFDLAGADLELEWNGVAETGAGAEVAGAEVAVSRFVEVSVPNAVPLNNQPESRVYQLDGFLTVEECERIAAITAAHLRRSTVCNDGESTCRTSSTCYFDPAHLPDAEESAFAAELDRRICELVGISPAYSETPQVQHYLPGQYFRTHTDYFNAGEQAHCVTQGNRTWTFAIYLNDVPDDAGGATHFPDLGVRVLPRSGRAVFWNNQNADGSENPRMRHEGEPLGSTADKKLIITKWFRERGFGPPFTRRLGSVIPAYTADGYTMSACPPDLFAALSDFTRSAFASEAAEVVAKADESHITYLTGITNATAEDGGEGTRGALTALAPLPAELSARVLAEMRAPLEAWAGVPLEPVCAYGVRSYNRGTCLAVHQDRVDTHIVSAVIHISDVSDRGADGEPNPWPLRLVDHAARRHDVVMRPGDAFFYEGARCNHGRPTPFEGEHHRNMYVHFRPAGWDGALAAARAKFPPNTLLTS